MSQTEKDIEENEDIVFKFWDKFYKADCLERSKILESLPIIKEIIELSKSDISDNIKLRVITRLFQSYLEDLMDYMEYKDEPSGKDKEVL